MSATPDPSMKMDFDTSVKLNIYEAIARTTRAPTSADVAAALSASPQEVEAAFDWTLSIGRNTESRISRGNWPFRNYDFEFHAFQ